MMGKEAWNFLELGHKIEKILYHVYLLNKKPDCLPSNQRCWRLEENVVNVIYM